MMTRPEVRCEVCGVCVWLRISGDRTLSVPSGLLVFINEDGSHRDHPVGWLCEHHQGLVGKESMRYTTEDLVEKLVVRDKMLDEVVLQLSEEAGLNQVHFAPCSCNSGSALEYHYHIDEHHTVPFEEIRKAIARFCGTSDKSERVSFFTPGSG